MDDSEVTVAELRAAVQRFVDERDWRQYHSPKNVAMSLVIEAAELMELFQWMDVAESRRAAADSQTRAAAAEELADILCYAFSMANVLGVDLASAVLEKLRKNELKYPAEQYRGRYKLD